MITKLKFRFICFITCFILLNCVLHSDVLSKSLPGVKKKVSVAEAFLPQNSLARVTGMVTDEQGNPLTGVTVEVKGTSIGTATNSKGNYSIEVENGQVIVFSIIGYETREIKYNGQAHLDVQLSIASTSLNEVVVNVGYGTQRKVSLTSAVSQISGEELVRRPVSSIQQALQGKLPGLTVLDKGGNPGSPNTNIIIRGVNTPYTPIGSASNGIEKVGDNGPLVIVDGIEQPFQNINPNDIETISVLKDASSTAIYGSRAANGVILITTKRAKTGKVSVNYEGFYAEQKSVSKPVPMGIEDYLRLENTAYVNVGSAPKYSEDKIQEYVKGSVTDPLKYPLPYNWYNVMLHTAPQVNHSLSVAGGNENFKARMSVRYQDQEGIIANTDSKLSEIRVNTDYKVSPKINITTDIDYRYENDLEPDNINEIFRQMMQNAIWDVPKYPNGDYGGGTQGNNPLLLAEKGGTNKEASDYIIGNIKGTWEIVKGLTFTTQFAGRSTSLFGKDYVNTWQTRDSTIVKKSNLHNHLTETRNNTREFTLNNLLNYNVILGNHSLKFLAGYSQIYDKSSSLTAYRQDFYNNDVQSIGQGANDATKSNGGGDAEWGLRSYFGRFNYAYNNKYLFEANARYDGSSRFTGNNKYSFFPSFSGGWRLSQEKFWTRLRNSVNELKLRGSW
ncbi:MAG TPA: TonB-dependent receptor, partial [Sphingobacteriaceae bacterium]|nr:TonB-dependent receptor [Sphingobacteriaceae bacterium]